MLVDPMYKCQSCGHMFSNKFNMCQHIASSTFCKKTTGELNNEKSGT